MCGYAGFALGAAGQSLVDEALLGAMGSSIRTRGPDAQGIWKDQDLAVGLVHQRLAIQDLSPLGAQPMASNSGRYQIAFNGEIYNFKKLKRELELLGYSFRGGSDTEVMLAAFEAWGLEASLPKMTGMFSFALVDREQQVLWLVRDRLGEKPLYYSHANGHLVFGSELKPLMLSPYMGRDLNPGALALLLRHDYIPAPWTIFANTYKLEPAHWLRFNLRDLSLPPVKQSYWKPSLSWDLHMTADTLHEQLLPLLKEVIADQMISDAPLGAFLSGGIDSSTIVALMQEQSSRPVKTFSVGFNVPGFNEAEHAKAVASHLGTEHTEYYVEPADALQLIPRLPEIYDEPFADSSQIPTYIVSQMTRQKVTVALSGDGGDELFAGYSRYENFARAFSARRRTSQQLMSLFPAPAVARFTRLLKASQSALPLALVEEKVRRYQAACAANNARDFYRTQVGYWLDPEAAVRGANPLGYALTDCELRTDVTASLQWCDMLCYLPDDILVKVDRAAMANSLETRVPLLDHRLVELSLKVPTAINVRQGITKQPLRRILYERVPQALVDRPKQGFAVPVAHWLKNELREWAEDLLSEAALAESGMLDASLIRQKWSAHLRSGHDYSFHLWSILMFQSWFRTYQRT